MARGGRGVAGGMEGEWEEASEGVEERASTVSECMRALLGEAVRLEESVGSLQEVHHESLHQWRALGQATERATQVCVFVCVHSFGCVCMLRGGEPVRVCARAARVCMGGGRGNT